MQFPPRPSMHDCHELFFGIKTKASKISFYVSSMEFDGLDTIYNQGDQTLYSSWSSHIIQAWTWNYFTKQPNGTLLSETIHTICSPDSTDLTTNARGLACLYRCKLGQLKIACDSAAHPVSTGLSQCYYKCKTAPQILLCCEFMATVEHRGHC